eukprot:jgi/Bigna1/46678/estExt_Genewise1.C_60163
MENAFHSDISEVVSKFGTDLKSGLSDKEVSAKREQYGLNSLEAEEETSIWELILEQFDDLLVKILLISALISFALAFFEDGDEADTAFVEPFVIFLILIINAWVGVWQELNAEKALAALKKLQPEEANTIRNGELKQIPAAELVPGDIVQITAGEKIPADIRIFELLTATLRCTESALTGEPEPVFKDDQTLRKGTPDLAAQKNMAFSGTVVAGGTGKGIVVATGMSTEVGKIGQKVGEAGAEKKPSPLKQKIDEFGTQLSWVIGAICLLVWIMNVGKFNDPAHGGWVKGCIYYLKIAVALGVAAIPEGLPAVITLCLALGTRRMAAKKAIVRKLDSVETLGCTSIICSDKTGTLTMNEMTCVEIAYADDSKQNLSRKTVTGASYGLDGNVEGIKFKSSDKLLLNIQRVCMFCNEYVKFNMENDKMELVRGMPTEAALVVLGEKVGIPEDVKMSDSGRKTLLPASNYFGKSVTRVATLEFERTRKSMSVLAKFEDSEFSHNVLLVKGAPEMVIKRCNRMMLNDGTEVRLNKGDRERLVKLNNKMAATPLRVLALAIKTDIPAALKNMKKGDKESEGHKMLNVPPEEYVDIEQDMVFLGLAGIKDPARPEVKESIARCHAAGMRVIMITGDTKPTAEAIGKEIGLFNQDEDLKGKSFTGAEFMKLDEKEQTRILLSDSGSRVFARATPADKMQIVGLLKKEGEICAMTGDGVNDAPALKAADIGVAMGIAGTEVAKEASDMVLADDNFATIVSAVEEGRSIYQNMKAFIRYLISSNIGEVASIFLTAAWGLPEGLIPVQLLWVNLVTDGPPATALGFNPVDPNIMRQPPRHKGDDLITRWVFFRYMVIGIYVGIATVGVFAHWYTWYDTAADGHSMVTLYQLSHWSECHSSDLSGAFENFTVKDFGGMSFQDNPCAYFTKGKVKASTMSLSVLVSIEMFNALNALSEDGSLFHIPPWKNPYLLLAMLSSFAMHFVILYVPFLAKIFQIAPLDFQDWMIVLAWSLPVILIDEVLKFVGRILHAPSGVGKKDKNV